MSRSTSSDLAKGRKYTGNFLYVQHVNKEKDLTSRISEKSLNEYFLQILSRQAERQTDIEDRKIFSDPNLSQYLKDPKANLGILKSFLKDKITHVQVYSNPLPAIPESGVTIHAFVVFQTKNTSTNEEMWWSLEKNGQYIVMQQSPVKEHVTEKLFVQEEKMCVKRLEPVKEQKSAMGNLDFLQNLLQTIWETNQLNNDYHLLFANCQNFASFVFEKSNYGGKKWSTVTSAFVDRFKSPKKKTNSISPADKVKYKWIVKDAKFFYYKAMAEGRRQDFEELAGNLTSESLNNVDSQGYTLLEWATVFSTSDWPIVEFLMEKGAEIPADEEIFLGNVLRIALEYLPSSNSPFLLFEGNSPFHQASAPECKMVAMEKILARTNSKKVNQHINRLGNTALHFAIREQFETVAEELLKREDVDVNVKNNCNQTALHLASRLIHMTNDLFKVILEKSTDANAQEEDGDTALHLAIMYKSETALKELFERTEINFNLNNNKNQTALHLASEWKDMPIDLFGVILKKSTDLNAQDENGCTALQCAIVKKCEAMIKELVNHVDVNLKNHKNQTALHLATLWKDMPIDLFRVILEKTTDVNAKDKAGLTALHLAIFNKSKTAVEELLQREDVEKFQNYSYFISVLSDDTFQFIGAEYL